MRSVACGVCGRGHGERKGEMLQAKGGDEAQRAENGEVSLSLVCASDAILRITHFYEKCICEFYGERGEWR